ncbi:MAG: ATP synthase subunit I [Clostridia bacterium]|nr:ATP synthase subunit I [Clostridia bacterium]
MNDRNLAFRETALVGALEAASALLTCLVYALLKKLGGGVWLGAFAGALLATLNYLIMALSADKVSREAVQGKTVSGRGTMRFSYILRLVLLFGVLALLVKMKVIEPIPAIVPIVLMQPIILFTQYFFQRKVK